MNIKQFNRIIKGCRRFLGLAILVISCLSVMGDGAKSILQKNDVGVVTVQKVVLEDGTVDQWYNYLHDEEGNMIGHIALDPEGKIKGVSIRKFRSDGQVEVTYNFTSNFTLRQRWVHQYDEEGNWLYADVYDKTGKNSGKILSRPSGYTKKPANEGDQ